MDEALTAELNPVVASHLADHTRCTSGSSPATALKISPTRRDSRPHDDLLAASMWVPRVTRTDDAGPMSHTTLARDDQLGQSNLANRLDPLDLRACRRRCRVPQEIVGATCSNSPTPAAVLDGRAAPPGSHRLWMSRSRAASTSRLARAANAVPRHHLGSSSCSSASPSARTPPADPSTSWSGHRYIPPRRPRTPGNPPPAPLP